MHRTGIWESRTGIALCAVSVVLCFLGARGVFGEEGLSDDDASEKAVVIVNAGYKGEITKGDIKNLYMGVTRRLPDGSIAEVYDTDSPQVRKLFCESVLGVSESYLKRYWVKMIVTGSAMPPPKLAPEEAVRTVASQAGSLAVVPMALAAGSADVRIVLRLD